MRVAVVYDCLFPYTVGGAERWYRNLAGRLAEEGHQVTYLTLRQWPRSENGELPGVAVIAVGPRMNLYAARGRRRILPPLVFGVSLLWHLMGSRNRYDVVHIASFPYFSLLAAAVTRRPGGHRLVVDWFELWTRAYWREYLGRWAGDIGWLVQRLCVRVGGHAFCFSRLHERRLREEGLQGPIDVLRGLYADDGEAQRSADVEPVVVFAGRHIPEKRVPAVVPALARARARAPELRGAVYGDGPERHRVLEQIRQLGLAEAVEAPGFVDSAVISDALAHALCMLLPSRREGYGLVVVEASALGTPSVVVAGADNAATELVEDGRNGVVTASAEPDELAAAILRVKDAGDSLRASTAQWFDENRSMLSLEGSLAAVARVYKQT